MGKARYNERKLMILGLLEAGFETSNEVADACGISQSCAASLLLRYWRQGLLYRYTGPRDNVKVYSVSEKGEERLEWLRAQRE